MMQPTYPRLIPDRDKRFKWYLDEPVVIHFREDHELHLPKGYRFDAHSVPFFFRLFFPQYNNRDVYCALVHDALVDFESLHRFNRKYIDDVYAQYMRKPEYYSNKWRAFWMPLAVHAYGFLRFGLWGDYRGEPKPGTKIVITLDDII